MTARAAACLAILLPAAAFGWSHAFTPAGDPIRWRQMPVQWQLGEEGWTGLQPAEVETAAAGAFDGWGRIECAAFSFRAGGRTTLGCGQAGVADPDRTNVVVWCGADERPAGFDGAIALTVTAYATEDGAMVDSDLLIDGGRRWSLQPQTADEYDLPAVLLHEAGHMAGMAHSNRSGAVMQPNLPPGPGARRELSDDDRNGLCDLYPDGQGTSGGCGSSPSAPAAAALAASLLVRWYRRRAEGR